MDVSAAVRTPQTPLPNYNRVGFAPVTTQRIRVLLTPTPGFGIGLKEIQVFDGVRCDRTVTGAHVGPLNVDSGVTCLAQGARVTGPVRVRPGAGLVSTGATVVGPLSATGASIVHLLDSTVVGPVSVTGSSRRVAVADSRFTGPVSLVGNVTGAIPIVVAGNAVTGPLACAGNQPAPVDHGRPNAVSGPATGQCGLT